MGAVRRALLCAILFGAMAAPASALASGMPQSGTIVVNASQAGATVGATQAQINAAWGQPYSCRHGRCLYEEYLSGQRGTVLFTTLGVAQYIEQDVTAYKTAAGIHVGSTKAQLYGAYGGQLTTCGGAAWPCILGTHNGVAVETVFQLNSSNVVENVTLRNQTLAP
jgi:hypothetical protein